VKTVASRGGMQLRKAQSYSTFDYVLRDEKGNELPLAADEDIEAAKQLLNATEHTGGSR